MCRVHKLIVVNSCKIQQVRVRFVEFIALGGIIQAHVNSGFVFNGVLTAGPKQWPNGWHTLDIECKGVLSNGV